MSSRGYQRIAVIGAGVIGVTTAYALARRGYAVTVYERQRYSAMETSYANGGQISACHTEAWNHVGTILKGLRWLCRADAPLRLNPWPGWHKYSWLAEFLANVRNYEAHTVALTRLAIESREHLHEIARREGIAFDLEPRGILHLYRQREAFEHALRVNELLRRGGLERYPVSAEDMQGMEPALRGDFHGGLYTPSDSSGDIHRFTRGLADVCARLGVEFRFDTQISALLAEGGCFRVREHPVLDPSRPEPARTDCSSMDQDGSGFDAVVVCAGVHSRRFARQLGDRVNVYPVKGYSITVALDDAVSRAAAPRVSLLDDEARIVSSRLGDARLRVAGTAELDGFNLDIRARRTAPLLRWVRDLFPEVATETAIPWCGLRPMMPGMLPRVGPGRRPGVFYNTGHGHLGWTLCAATAEAVARAIHAADSGHG
ncbi:MAG: D-amino acid dehydrogenase [Gammaproteobacteria bacterium]|nr:D-amino acid dehydrogenase [Gammaproteobacteria bacterium]